MDSLPKITVPDACSSFRVYAAFPQAWSPGILLTTWGQRYHSSHVAFSTGEGAETHEEGHLFCMANTWQRLPDSPEPPLPVYFPRLPFFLLPPSLHFPPFVILYADPYLFLFPLGIPLCLTTSSRSSTTLLLLLTRPTGCTMCSSFPVLYQQLAS